MKVTKPNAFINNKRNGNFSVFTFNTESSYQMPIILLTSDISQFQRALTYSARLIEYENTLSDDYIKDTIFSDYIKLIEEKHQRDMANLEKTQSLEIVSRISGITQCISDKEVEYSDQIKQLKSDYDQQLKVLTKEKKKLEDDITATKHDLESQYEKEIRQLRRLLAEREAEFMSASKNESLIREQCNNESERVIKVIEDKHKQSLDALRQAFEVSIKLKDESIEQKEQKILLREQDFDRKQQRNSNSSFRGKDGENLFNEIVESKTKWKLTDTSKIAQSCDFSSIIHGIPVFFEVKKYSNNVGSSQVVKFLRDMKEHPEVQIGIFISLETNIACKNKDIPISIEWIHNSQCAVYIQSFNELDTEPTLALIDQLIQMVCMYNKLIGSRGEVSQETILQTKIDKARIYIERYISESIELLKCVTNDQKRHRDLIERTYSHIISVLKSQADTIKTALEILTGEHLEDNTVDESLIPVEVIDTKPKKSTKKTKN
jgi:hypothetical protein